MYVKYIEFKCNILVVSMKLHHNNIMAIIRLQQYHVSWQLAN